MNKIDLEKYSSAFTLSDMEIFIFPELLYALVLANIMSPLIWEWRDDPWFKNIDKRSPIQKINRLKQYIMDHYIFNLDLETWGLTHKQKELERFKEVMDEETLAQSNALFGYEGDKYYFDMDIRKHFGLDKYNSDIIPYWKTETVEAMDAFKYKDNYTTGAGECVSLSTLYAAALFVVLRIPLKDIFLMATPLHSQNFININEGVLTNNRRIVTKNMWFNGTSLSTKARRALENEQVTIVSHISGYIHSVYKQAHIDKKAFEKFSDSLHKYLKASFNSEILSNFLRKEQACQECFQYYIVKHNKKYFLEVKRIYEYEHTSSNSFTGDSRNALLDEIDQEEFRLTPFENKVILNDIEEYIKKEQISSDDDIDNMITKLMISQCDCIKEMFVKLKDFMHIQPELPLSVNKKFIPQEQMDLSTDWTRHEVIEYIRKMSSIHSTAQLGLYAYRDMNIIEWSPYICASINRNPVSIEALKKQSFEKIIIFLDHIKNQSIYNGTRLAMPDEVYNFGRGDGIEKAVLLANIIKHRYPNERLRLIINKKDVILKYKDQKYKFISHKGLKHEIDI